VIESFRTGSAAVFLISLKAGGFGLTLTEADYVFLLDPWWNPAAESQAIDRTHRIGQTRSVVVYRLVAEHTIEEEVLALQQQKAELCRALMDGADVGERELLAFRTGARRVHLTRCQQLRVLETLERAVQTAFGDVPARRGPQRLGNGGDADRLMVGDERQDDGREHRLLIGLDP